MSQKPDPQVTDQKAQWSYGTMLVVECPICEEHNYVVGLKDKTLVNIFGRLGGDRVCRERPSREHTNCVFCGSWFKVGN